MIAYLQGKLTLKTPTHVFMETSGIGYMLKISLNTYTTLQHLESCKLHTSLVVKSENQSVSGFDLYGFYEEAEKDLFEKLISVSGVGAATARMMLSTFKPDEIRQAILMENEAMIQSIKGIGPKSAKRLILELKDKMGKPLAEYNLTSSANNMIKEEALSALVALGFSKQAADKVIVKLLSSGGNQSVEGLIKDALKLL
ncbi:MAG: Holliday junction branch migration protein RuvA [Chitinophagales bacterium]|jgi:Holliday junction DNA helicase RuvA|nr:Holliday junction branch migration protein RuvA [Chitinophagales bacterium]